MATKMPSKIRGAVAERKTFAPIFAALGDETRLELVTKLCDGSSRSISELTTGTELTRQAVTKHLRVLEVAELVQSVRSGRENLFELAPAKFDDMQAYLAFVAEAWAENTNGALARLKTFVES